MAYLFCYERKLARNDGTAEEPNIVEYLQGEAIRATDADYDIQYAEALKCSYNGEVTVEEVEDEPETVTQLDRVEAQATYTAMMTDTLLEE